MIHPSPDAPGGLVALALLTATLAALHARGPRAHIRLWAGAWACGTTAALISSILLTHPSEPAMALRWLLRALQIALLIEGTRRLRGFAAIGRTPWALVIFAGSLGMAIGATAPAAWAESLFHAGVALAMSYAGAALILAKPVGWGSMVAGSAHLVSAGLGIAVIAYPPTQGPLLDLLLQGLPLAIAFGMVDHVSQRAVHRARTREERYRSLFDGLADGRLRLDASGHPTHANPPLARMLGFETPEEVVTTDPDSLFGDTLNEPVEDPGRGLTELRWTRADGSSVWVMLRIRALTDRMGQVRGYEAYVSDTTEAHERAHGLHRDEKLMALGHLAGGVAHDFNNLLAVVAGSLDLAAAVADEPTKVMRHLERARAATDRGTRLTTRLRDFARLRPERLEVFDLYDTVSHSIDMLQATLGDGLTVHFSGLGPAPVKGDRGQFDRILMNLVLNAKDALSAGGDIWVHVEAVDDNVILEVRDNGPGIGEEDLPRIFDPFFTTRPGGTGLGLATVFGIVTAAEGTLDVTSTPRGTTFRVSLPKAVSRSQRHQAHSFPPPPRQRRTILVVDDEAALREVASEILVNAGFRVLQARDGPEALEMARANGYVDLLVTDVAMPKMSGSELADAMQLRFADLPVVMVSGFPDRRVPAPSLEGPMRSFLAKPFRRRELLDAVRAALALRHPEVREAAHPPPATPGSD